VGYAVIFDTQKPIYFLDKFHIFLGSFLFAACSHSSLPAFSRLTWHRIASVHPSNRPSTIHESAENVCSLDCEAEYARKQLCRLKALSGHKLPIYMWLGARAA
jgi:hypothetical protein